MNEILVRKILKYFVKRNKEQWVKGIKHSGVQREIENVSITRFTPPVRPYHVNISCRRYSIDFEDTLSLQVSKNRTTFDVSFELADYIYSLPDDDAMYEYMVGDFLTVRDRIVASLYDAAATYGYLEDESAHYKVNFVPDTFSVSNVEEFSVRDIPVMYSVIDFSLYSC